MINEKLAPIVLFVYNRPDHTLKTLTALKANKLADESRLFIYCDGPKAYATDEQREQIQKVRNVIRQEKWCGEINIIESDVNIGCRDSIIRGISAVINKYGKIIVIEDDLITSPAFLTYMNKTLAYYEHRLTVFSISGHSHSPLKFQVPSDYDYDVFASPRIFNWGWGTWKDRWNQTDWTMSYYDKLLQHPEEQKAFSRMGDDMMIMLRDEHDGRSSAWDIQFTFAHFANHAISIVPCISYTHNIGLDGSGTHCYNVHNEQNVLLNLNESPKLLDNLYFDTRIINRLYSAFCRKKRPLWQKVWNKIAKLVGRNDKVLLKGRVYA